MIARANPTGGQAGLSLIEILIAILVIGAGVGIFMKMNGTSGTSASGSSKMMRAGQLVERHIESIRIGVARDTIGNWPPDDTSFTEDGLTVKRKVSTARSPKDNSVLPNVRKVDVIVTWGAFKSDTLDVTTYVAKRF
jgi:Tfp pilus assembly protein PilV